MKVNLSRPLANQLYSFKILTIIWHLTNKWHCILSVMKFFVLLELVFQFLLHQKHRNFFPINTYFLPFKTLQDASIYFRIQDNWFFRVGSKIFSTLFIPTASPWDDMRMQPILCFWTFMSLQPLKTFNMFRGTPCIPYNGRTPRQQLATTIVGFCWCPLPVLPSHL